VSRVEFADDRDGRAPLAPGSLRGSLDHLEVRVGAGGGVAIDMVSSRR
jgi:hypothetical protein